MNPSPSPWPRRRFLRATTLATDEGRDTPPAALAEARRADGIAADAFHVLAPGESTFA